MSEKDSKTEEATPKRLSDAKKKGQTPKSAELVPAISLMAFSMLGATLGGYVFRKGLVFLQNSLSVNYNMVITSRNIRAIFFNKFIDSLLVVAPFALISMLIGIVVNIAQAGFLITGEPLKPDLNRINPISGFKNLFSKKSVFTLIKNISKLILVFYIAYSNITESYKQILNSGNIGTQKLFTFLSSLISSLIYDIVVAMLVLAIVDFVFQKREFKKNLRMTKQEIKEEYKQMEGDPQIKSARRRRQMQLSASRMMSDIPTSTVVITNPTHIAVALRYELKKDKAPLVVAKGADKTAAKIKEIAKENKIPIIENVALARTMYKDVEVGEYIPFDLYQTVAEILALVYKLKEKNKGKI
ncbi:MAG: flagellar biosynthesis protein FlhB [Tissierellia bacterium]|nr:flagellar biosynthesis protein FlhB [Tissierellia bacterium]MDD4726416.1 flagellar biosynthesis protein FlhB [Tissierellia bacterium]